MRSWRLAVLAPILASGCVFCTGAGAQADARIGEAPEGMADARIFNGFKRFHAGCNHCHGHDGLGSSFGPSIVDRLPDIETFRRIVRNGTSNGASVMKGFGGDPNVSPISTKSMRIWRPVPAARSAAAVPPTSVGSSVA
jgi:mono/diheme cytochrome c family protein